LRLEKVHTTTPATTLAKVTAPFSLCHLYALRASNERLCGHHGDDRLASSLRLDIPLDGLR